MITDQTEYNLLEAQYLQWIAAGMPSSITVNGRSRTNYDMMKIRERMTQLQAQLARANAPGGGMFGAAVMRPTE